MNGTVIGPVVTPPESYASGIISPFPLSIKSAARANVKRYAKNNSVAKSFLNTTLITAIIKNKPTEIPTKTIKTVRFTTALTCSARTDRSGSAIVIKRPIIKAIATSNVTFLCFVKPEPICSPIGVIAISAPKLNRVMPIIINTAHIANVIISVVVKSVIGVKASTKTIIATGATEIADSLNLDSNPFNILSALNY